MKYLILGSSGQIGSALVSYLGAEQVFLFDIVNSTQEDLRIYDNKLLHDYMKQSDFVFFLAFDVGGSTYLSKYQNTFEFLSNNIKIMNTTFDLLKLYKLKFVFASSQMSNMLYSPYGNLKALGEEYTHSLNGLVVKLWNVYGIENDLKKSHVITDFILKAKNTGLIDMLTDGTEERQFLYSKDCCEALHILSRKYDQIPRNKELHITTGEWVSIFQVAKVIKKFFPSVKIEPSKNKDNLQKFKRNEADPFILKYWASKTSMEDGIKQIIAYYTEK